MGEMSSSRSVDILNLRCYHYNDNILICCEKVKFQMSHPVWARQCSGKERSRLVRGFAECEKSRLGAACEKARRHSALRSQSGAFSKCSSRVVPRKRQSSSQFLQGRRLFCCLEQQNSLQKTRCRGETAPAAMQHRAFSSSVFS